MDKYNDKEILLEYTVHIQVKPVSLLLEDISLPIVHEKEASIPATIENPAGLRLNGTLCDFEIICQDKKFSCHKAVLATNVHHFEVHFHCF